MQIVALSQGSQEWFEWRKQGITATEAAAILGLSEDKTKWLIFALKRGIIHEEDLSKNPLVQYGKENEANARRWYEEKYNTFLVPVCVVHDSVPWLRASLDGLSTTSLHVEIKCPHETTFDDIKENQHQSTAFKQHWIQVQYQLMVTGGEYAHLVYWRHDRTPMVYKVVAHKQRQAEIFKACLEFYEDHIVKGIEPVKDPNRDVFVPEDVAAKTWESIALSYAKNQHKIQQLNDDLETLKRAQLILQSRLGKLAGEYARADHAGLKMTRFERRGKVRWHEVLKDAGIQLSDEELDQYRDPTNFDTRFTVSDELAEQFSHKETLHHREIQ